MTAPPLEAWGLAGLLEPLAGGHRNTVLACGDHVLKTTRRSEAAVAWLVDLCDVARDAGIRVAPPLRSGSGAFKIAGWVCERRLSGVAPDDVPSTFRRGLPERLSMAKGVGQREGFCSLPELPAAGLSGEAEMAHLPSQIRVACDEAFASLAGMPVGVVHGDLNASNILVAPGRAPALIDWDESRLDVLALDDATLGGVVARARLAWEVASSWSAEPEYARRQAKVLLGRTEFRRV